MMQFDLNGESKTCCATCSWSWYKRYHRICL